MTTQITMIAISIIAIAITMALIFVIYICGIDLMTLSLSTLYALAIQGCLAGIGFIVFIHKLIQRKLAHKLAREQYNSKYACLKGLEY